MILSKRIILVTLPAILLAGAVLHADVPALARTKAAAEAGDPAAQFEFAKAFGAGSPDRDKWLKASAAQDYGPAEDELAWARHWSDFATTFSQPTMRASHLQRCASAMKEALIYASTAADKGFSHSRLLLALAFAHGYIVPQDQIEAYYWLKLAGEPDLLSMYPHSQLKTELLKTMDIEAVKKAEALAATKAPVGTAMRIRNLVVLPELKLTGLFSRGDKRIAVISGTQFRVQQSACVTIGKISVTCRCIALDERSVTILLGRENTLVLLRMGQPAQLVHN